MRSQRAPRRLTRPLRLRALNGKDRKESSQLAIGERSSLAWCRLKLISSYAYLIYVLKGGFVAVVKITVRRNGPYRVEAPEGSIELVDADGQKYDLTGKPAFSLCRCGGSVTKPFCDGTHSRIGFQGAESAVKRADNP
jgi:CDGSH-type Zn-finger protein